MFMAEMVAQEIPDTDKQTQFFSNINNATSLLALILQLLVVKHVVRKFGIGVSMSILPIASIAGFIVVAIDPSLAIVGLITVLRRALGFGFSKPTTDMLYSVVTPEDKYKTKNFIDTAVYRLGDVVGTMAIKAFMLIGISMTAISVVMLPFAAIWAFVAVWLGRAYRKRAKQAKLSETL